MDLEQLPIDGMVCILLHLDYKSLLRMKVVSKSWRDLVLPDQTFWRRKFEMDFGELEGDVTDFENEYKLEYGWRFKEPKVMELIGHERGVFDVQTNGCILVSGSADKSVRLWDLERMECVHDFQEIYGVCSVVFDNGNLFAAMGSGEIHVWSLASKQRCHSWQAHINWVYSVSISRGHLISGDFWFIKVWDVSTFECLRVFEVQGIKEIFVDGDEIFCGLQNEKRVHVFHEADGLLYTLDVGQKVHSVCANTEYIFVGCLGNIQVWNRDTKELMAILDPIGDGNWNGKWDQTANVWCSAWKLVSVSGTGHIKVWDTRNLTCINHVNVKLDNVACMDSEKGKVVIGTFQGEVCVLDFGW